MQGEEIRCERCGAIITPPTWWQINVNGKAVCKSCVESGTGGMFAAPREYDRGR